MNYDYIVIGAGIAGLHCAQTLAQSGATVQVLERSGRAGGRCASRNFDGTLVDYGSVFVHGTDPDFIASVRELPGLLPNWPERVHGNGPPCRPDALSDDTVRFGLSAGINVFPASLLGDLQVQFRTTVVSLGPAEGGIVAHDEDGGAHTAGTVILALALEQTERLVQTLPTSNATRSTVALLGMFASVPCLTAVAFYETDQPRWDISYPEESEVILLASNESSKRQVGKAAVVYQATPAWSHRCLEREPDEWSNLLIAEAARLYGRWAGEPTRVHPHRWRFSRVDQASELAAAPVMQLDSGRIGFCGDLFAPGGGIQAAWISGRETARRLMSNP